MTKFLITLCLVILFNSYLFLACECDCTLNYVSYSVFVEDESGEPITDARVISKFKKSGKVIRCNNYCSKVNYGDGVLRCINVAYTIMCDDYVEELNRYLEVEVTVEKEGYETAKRDYIFETDSCSCHIRKVSGDDVIKLKRL